jgi:hypothetical protein
VANESEQKPRAQSKAECHGKGFEKPFKQEPSSEGPHGFVFIHEIPFSGKRPRRFGGYRFCGIGLFSLYHKKRKKSTIKCKHKGATQRRARRPSLKTALTNSR